MNILLIKVPLKVGGFKPILFGKHEEKKLLRTPYSYTVILGNSSTNQLKKPEELLSSKLEYM